MMNLLQRQKHSVLVLEDDRALSETLRDFLQEEGWEVQCAATAGEARAKLSGNVFDVVLADYLLPDADGLTVLDHIQRHSPFTKVMVMTGLRDMDVASRAFRMGAVDLIAKPFDVNELEARLESFVAASAPAAAEQAGPEEGPRLVGKSHAVKRAQQLISLVATRNSTVLVTGESGTGKELVARSIHAQSARRKQPFVSLHCGAIPEDLLEDELFGHVRGAYTDAGRERIGKLRMARGGTLFLDEIGSMSPSLQAKLLRVLEERDFERLGSRQTLRLNVRLLAATDSDLGAMVQRGEFRSDLFYRLNAVPIYLPPLRERREDIPPLVDHFLRLFAVESATSVKSVDPDTVARLGQCSWRGNVRELRNVLELAFILSGERSVIGPADFPIFEQPDAGPLPTDVFRLPEEGVDLKRILGDLEGRLIARALQRTGGNKDRAARLLGLKRTTLVAKLRRLETQAQETAQVANQ